MMYFPTGEAAGEIDRYTQDEIGIPGMVLMEKAAEAVAAELKRYLKEDRDRVLCLAETGNNGGDCVAAARILFQGGIPVELCVLGGLSAQSESFRLQIKIAENLQVPLRKWNPELQRDLTEGRYRVIADGIFGVGLHRSVTGIQKEAIQLMNRCDTPVLSIDVPSGIHSGTGEMLGDAVKADVTVTFDMIKRGLLEGDGRCSAGKILLRKIGLEMPDALSCRMLRGMEREDALPLLMSRNPEAHKGTYGHLFLVAGSEHICGAAMLSAGAGLTAGAGLVKVCTAEENRNPLVTRYPELLTDTLPAGVTADEIRGKIRNGVKWADAVTAGPGLGTDERAEALLDAVLEAFSGREKAGGVLILDADALNLLRGNRLQILRNIAEKNPVILTPHVLEAFRLIREIDGESGTISFASADSLRREKERAAELISGSLGVITVLKDARTVIAAPGSPFQFMNITGNDGMASGGSGDVLAGLLGGFFARAKGKKTAFPLAAAVTWLHGSGGDRAARERGPEAMRAEHIIQAAGEILRDQENFGK